MFEKVLNKKRQELSLLWQRKAAYSICNSFKLLAFQFAGHPLILKSWQEELLARE
jgi:hypothetical protein